VTNNLIAGNITATGNITLGGVSRNSWPQVFIDSQRIEDNQNIDVPAEYTKSDCKLLVSIESSNVGYHSDGSLDSTYGDSFGDLGEWQNNHYAGIQAFYTDNPSYPTTKWKITCRYGFTRWDDKNPVWVPAKCRYLLICVK